MVNDEFWMDLDHIYSKAIEKCNKHTLDHNTCKGCICHYWNDGQAHCKLGEARMKFKNTILAFI